MVDRSQKGVIGACGLLVMQLKRRRLDMLFLRPSQFLGRRLSSGSPRPAIEADIVQRDVVDDGLVVGVGYDGCVHVSDGCVVKERPVTPISALVTDAAITEAVIDAAIISDVWPPISGVPNINPTIVGPIARRPEHPNTRR